jgi:NodT family efflux transporter outer membrane factor (OMF) lipoprotein
VSAWLLACVLAGCQTVPPQASPSAPLPISWTLEAPWRAAEPGDALSKGPWWQRFNDPVLDALIEQSMALSPNLALARARMAQARAALAGSAANERPQIGLGARAARQAISANRPLSNYNAGNQSTTQNDVTAALTVGYEVDLAGRVQHSVEAGRAGLEQATADVENARLILTADLAANYFNAREIDTELDVLGRSLGLQRRALELVTARHDLGAATGLDVAQQQALLDSTLVQVDLLRRQRAAFEHAVGTLAGVDAPGFALPLRQGPAAEPPAIPLGVPSDILQRRPDVASAERAMAAANAQIGVARAAFFPSVNLGGSYGSESRSASTLLAAPSLIWSVGVSAVQVLFDGGRLQAGVDFARASHAATVANYRRVVLAAMQEVEDGITGMAALERAEGQARQAAAAAGRVLDMATARYEGGAAVYLEVIAAQQAVLASERQAAQLRGQRLLTAVFLVKALGGDWQPAQVPTPPKLASAGGSSVIRRWGER